MEAALMNPGRIKSCTKIAGFEVLSYLASGNTPQALEAMLKIDWKHL